MILSDIKIHSLRNISCAHLFLNSRFNFIFGANGSGKTSVLEALYLLSCGHSFRSREISPIISHDQQVLTVFARSFNQDTISIQKSCSDPTQIKINNQFCTSTSQLAYALPCQIFYSDIFQIIDAGPSVRRSVLDWGLFHVKHDYLLIWKEYKKVLKHRNALLKKHAPYNQFIPWDQQLNHLAIKLDAMRKEYFARWKVEFFNILSQLTESTCEIYYFKGWDKKESGKSLEEVLAEHFTSDNHKTYTQFGAHQADILIVSNDSKAKNFLSRGQQKIILIGLKLAQARMLDFDCMYLFDDLVSELDDTHQAALLNYLAANKGQYVITSVNSMPYISQINSEYRNLFSIKNGIIEAK